MIESFGTESRITEGDFQGRTDEWMGPGLKRRALKENLQLSDVNRLADKDRLMSGGMRSGVMSGPPILHQLMSCIDL